LAAPSPSKNDSFLLLACPASPFAAPENGLAVLLPPSRTEFIIGLFLPLELLLLLLLLASGVGFLLKLAGGEDFSNSPPATSVFNCDSISGPDR